MFIIRHIHVGIWSHFRALQCVKIILLNSYSSVGIVYYIHRAERLLKGYNKLTYLNYNMYNMIIL